MSHCLEIYLRDTRGALLRILGTTERRGFILLNLHLDDAIEDIHRLQLRVATDDRSVQVLARQLARLHDVFEVRISAPAAQLAAAGA